MCSASNYKNNNTNNKVVFRLEKIECAQHQPIKMIIIPYNSRQTTEQYWGSKQQKIKT